MMYKWIVTIEEENEPIKEYHYLDLEAILDDLRGDLQHWLMDTSVRVVIAKAE